MKTVIVTGASSGIGRAVALRMLAAGWQVGLIARRADRLTDIARDWDRAIPLPCDVTQEDEVAHAFDAFTREAGRLDVLFNNAGIFVPPAPIDETPVADWTQALAVNLTGMFLCARAAFGQMRRQSPQGGRIITAAGDGLLEGALAARHVPAVSHQHDALDPGRTQQGQAACGVLARVA